MLLIQRIYYPQRLKIDYVICPACKRGQLSCRGCKAWTACLAVPMQMWKYSSHYPNESMQN